MAASIKCTGNSADISSNLNGNQVPGSPCTWRKYLPMAGGPLRLVNHRISAHPDGPTPVELNFIKNQSIRNDTNAEPEHVSNNGHLSDTDCGRKCPATGRESLSYGQLLGSPMVSRRTIGNGKFQSLEKNLKLLKSNALTSAPIETTLHSTRSTHLLRRQASFVGETFMNRNASNESTKPFGSSWSLASAATAPIDSTLSNKLDRPQAGGHHEMRKLKRELQLSHQKVGSLTCQLNTNAQMVSAYEQSLSAMTARVAQLSSLSQQKDAEMQRLMQIVEQLGGDHHHHTATMSTDNGHDSRSNVETNSNDDHHNQRKPNSLIRRHTFTSGSDQFRMKASLTGQSLTGNDEIDSKCRNKKSAKSLKTMRPNTGIVVASNDSIGLSAKNSWLRSSLTKAFRKQKNGSNLPSPEHSTKVTGSALTTDSSVNDSSHPVHLSYQHHANRLESESGNIEPDNVVELKRQLRMTESQLTEVRLESLNGAHQLDSLRELVEQLRHQLTNVQQENERLCKFVQHKSLASSKSSMHSISSGALNAVLSPNSSTNMPITSGNCIPLSVHTPPIHCAADKPTSCNAVAVDTGHDGITSLASPFTLMTNLVSNQPIVTTTAITSTSPSSSPAAKPSETTIKVLVNSFSTSSCTTNGSVDSSSVSGSKLVQSNSNNSSGHTLHDTLNEPDEHFLNALSDDLSISWTSGCEVDQDVVGVMCSVVLPDWLDSGKIKSKTSSSLQLALTSGSDAAEDNSCVCLGQFWVTGETSWLQMDEKVQARIAQYLSLMDPDRSIGLTLHSFIGYRIGLEPALRSFASSLAFSHRNSASTRSSLSFRNSFGSEADCALSLWSNDHCSSPTSSSSSPSNAQLTQSPYSYLVDRPTLQIQLATRLDHFCLQTQIPRCTLLRFLSVLGDHRRLLIHGPTGSGKSQSARLLAQYLVNRNASKRGSFSRADMECNIATCQATATNEDELHSNFASTADQWQMHLQSNCQSLPDTLPIVMLIDDLQHWKNSDLTLAPLFSMPANNGYAQILQKSKQNEYANGY